MYLLKNRLSFLLNRLKMNIKRRMMNKKSRPNQNGFFMII